MPFITISTLFLLAGVFTGGCLLSWYLNDRKNERERARIEDSMTRALEKRYEVYEDLEQSFHRIFTRMDEVRENWSSQMSSVQESVEGSLGETTFVREGVEELVGRIDQMGAELHRKMEAVLALAQDVPATITDPAPVVVQGTAGMSSSESMEPSHTLMRVDNPELWDLERAFERRNAEQLAEISAKSQRVQELMEKVETLEPMALQLSERDREFVALEDDFQQMEEKVAMLEEERESLGKTNRALEETRRARVAELSQRIEELELVEIEAGELRKQVTGLRADVSEHKTISEGHEVTISEREAQIKELEFKYTETSVELEGVREDHSTAIEVASVERVRYEQELDVCQETIDGLNASMAEHEATIAELRGKIEGLEARADSLTVEVSDRDAILVDREERLDELQQKLGGLQSELEQRATELDERERKFEELQGAWKMATGQVEMQRSKLASHMNHFHAAQEMLSQLKPMLEELETRLITEDGDGEATSEAAKTLHETTVVVSEMMNEPMVVNDGSLEELPEDTMEIEETSSISVDEPPAALPSQAAEETATEEEASEQVVQSDLSADSFDLSMLDDDPDLA